MTARIHWVDWAVKPQHKQTKTARIPGFEFLIPCRDWNGHVGRVGTGYREVHGGMGYRRYQMLRVIEPYSMPLAFNLPLGNTCYKKHDSHFITYKSGKGSHADRLHPFP